MKIPTKQNILTAMRWLVQNCQAGDSLVFYFSGHGQRQVDCSGDESDGFDEALCPLDHATEGLLVDDTINETIVRPLPHGAKLHAIVDACHSGTVLDLPLICRMKRWSCERINLNFFFFFVIEKRLFINFSFCD